MADPEFPISPVHPTFQQSSYLQVFLQDVLDYPAIAGVSLSKRSIFKIPNPPPNPSFIHLGCKNLFVKNRFVVSSFKLMDVSALSLKLTCFELLGSGNGCQARPVCHNMHYQKICGESKRLSAAHKPESFTVCNLVPRTLI